LLGSIDDLQSLSTALLFHMKQRPHVSHRLTPLCVVSASLLGAKLSS
jgi:hypothetical protein